MSNIIVDQRELSVLSNQLSEMYLNGVVYLQGEIGSGKTFFTQSFIQSCGFIGYVSSPTYSILEKYSINHRSIIHMDLYRLNDPSELDFIGLDDFSITDNLFFIEWPEKALDIIPKPNVILNLEYYQGKRKLFYKCDNKFQSWEKVFLRWSL